MSKIYRKRKLPSYEVIIKQTPFFFTDENGEEHFDSEDEVVQELVRCRDCKYYGNDRLKKDYTEDKRYKPRACFNGAYAKYRDQNFFCADGERKEE